MIFLCLYLLVAVSGIVSIPVLDGYHKKKYGREFNIIQNDFKYIPDTFFIVMGSIFWPVALPLFLAAYPIYRLGRVGYRALEQLGGGIIQNKIEAKQKDKYLKEAELEIEKMLMGRHR